MEPGNPESFDCATPGASLSEVEKKEDGTVYSDTSKDTEILLQKAPFLKNSSVGFFFIFHC